MYIPFGRTIHHRTLGRAADFCPFCRGFRPFRVLQVESIRHFYTLPMGGRIDRGQSRVCESCGLLSPAPPEGYLALSADPDADLDTLIAETNPNIRRNWASRLLLEERIAARKLTPGERAGLLREPFEMAAEVLGRRNDEGKLDLPSGLGCLGTVLLPVACMTLLPMAWKASGESIETVAVIAGGCSLAFAVLAISTDARRHARKAVLPRLIGSLRPLDPSAEEVDMILESFRQARSPLADVVRPSDVVNGLLERWE
jgi:hypothetical protein